MRGEALTIRPAVSKPPIAACDRGLALTTGDNSTRVRWELPLYVTGEPADVSLERIRSSRRVRSAKSGRQKRENRQTG